MNDIQYISKRHKQAKARFWKTVAHNPMYPNPLALSNAVMASVAGMTSMAEKLGQADFKDWFLNNEHNCQMLEVGAGYAVERLIDILAQTATGEKGGATVNNQVAAAKIMLDMAGYGKKDAAVEFKDKDIAGLEEDELEAFIRARSKAIDKEEPG